MSFCKLSWLICVGCVAQLYLVASEEIVEPTWLAAHLKDPNIKILDASYDLKPKPDWKEFKTKFFGKFDELIKTHTNAAYTSEHIPGAIYYNIDIAYFPGKFELFSLYPPELYEQYIQKLGINQNDQIIVYSRNDNAGMLYAAFVWWTLKVYGHKNVQVLNGGFDAWKKVGNPTEKGAASATAVGNWKAGPIDKSLVATFDDLTHDPKGGNLFETNMTTINMLDARPEEQFTGKTPLGFPAPKATGSHVAGAKNVPLKNVVGDEGVKDKSVLENALKSVNFDPSKPTVAMCNGGVQSSLLTLGLTRLEIKARVYIGSMAELAARASQYINSK